MLSPPLYLRLAWIVKCDNCGLLVDATENPYHENFENMGDICHYCWLELNEVDEEDGE